MDKIKIELLQYDDLNKLVQLACHVTRGANKYSSPQELIEYINNNPWSDKKIIDTLTLPHSKVSRFNDFLFLITGSSRRFLAQIMTHHVGIVQMSGSLQYSDHSKQSLEDKFCVPYELFEVPAAKEAYIVEQKRIMTFYNTLIAMGLNNDTAGYTAPQSLRNILMIKVNLEELKFIGNQRLCNRNTDETSYVIGRMIEEVINETQLPFDLFAPSCYKYNCNEAKYTCGKPIKCFTMKEYLDERFPLIRK